MFPRAVYLPSPGLCIFLYKNKGIDRIYLPPLKHFLCFLIVLLVATFLNLLGVSCGMWDLSSPTQDATHVPCNGSTES